ncbi:MAG TPA: hypothetical protein PKA64_15095 [Myxococcota bacterium]|nr:hypothetical protein [Myxococcota bacterium]
MRFAVELGELLDAPEDHLALAAGVAGVDQALDVVARAEAPDQVEPLLLPLAGLDAELLGHDRQLVDRPPAQRRIVVLRRGELEQVAQRERHQVAVALEVFTLMIGEPAERGRDVSRHAGLLRDDQELPHPAPPPRPPRDAKP